MQSTKGLGVNDVEFSGANEVVFGNAALATIDGVCIKLDDTAIVSHDQFGMVIFLVNGVYNRIPTKQNLIIIFEVVSLDDAQTILRPTWCSGEILCKFLDLANRFQCAPISLSKSEVFIMMSKKN